MKNPQPYPVQSIFGFSLLCCIAITLALFVNNEAELNFLFLLIGMGLFIFLWKKPEFGILLFLTTFLMTYPPALRGSGVLTPNILLGALFGLLLGRRIITEEEPFWFMRIKQFRVFLLIALWMGISTLFAPEAPAYVSTAKRTGKVLWDFYTQLAFLLFMIHFIQTEKQLKLIFGLLLLLILLTIPSGVYSAFFNLEDYRATATFGINMAKNSNHFAFYCLFALTTFWYIRQEANNIWVKSILLFTICTLVFFVLLSASRNALLNLMVLSFIFMVETGIDYRKILKLLFLLLVIMVLMIKLIPDEHKNRILSFKADPTQRDASGSLSERTLTVKTGVKMFFDTNPLTGVGPGNFRWIRQLYYDSRRVATHNSYLWALLSGGIPLLVLYFVLYWSCLKDLLEMQKRYRLESKIPIWMIKTTRTTLILFLVFSIFTEAWLEIFPYILIAITIIISRIMASPQEAAPA